jgi:Tfp pilus assembly protein PilN
VKQDINLYQQRFRPRRQWLSARSLMLLLGVLAVALAVASLQLYRQRDAASARAERLQQEQQAVQQDLARLQQKIEALLADDQWARREAALKRQLRDHRLVIDSIAEQRFGGGDGFSRPLAALAGLSVDSVWLERILLSERDVELRGAALQAPAVPDYFEQLKAQRVFADRAFERFEIRRSPRYDWKLEFTIASREKTDEP